MMQLGTQDASLAAIGTCLESSDIVLQLSGGARAPEPIHRGSAQLPQDKEVDASQFY